MQRYDLADTILKLRETSDNTGNNEIGWVRLLAESDKVTMFSDMYYLGRQSQDRRSLIFMEMRAKQKSVHERLQRVDGHRFD